MKIKTYINMYDSNLARLKELNISKKDYLKSFFLGYLIALLVVISPFIVVSNLTIYSQYQILILFIISIICCIFLTLGDFIYHYFLGIYCPNVKEISLKINYILNFILYFLICMIMFGILLFILR